MYAATLVCAVLPLIWSTGAAISCEEHLLCGDCITFNETRCSWCADPEVRTSSRCQASFVPGDCEDIQNPSSVVNDSDSASESVEPTHFRVLLRPGQPLTLPINVTSIRNAPVDLYTLLDTSCSQLEELQAVRQVSVRISDSLNDITSDVAFGYGTFVDKPALPYSRRTIDNECVVGTEGACVIDCFDFRHFGPLTTDPDELQRRANRSQATPNVDAPESGFDAMAQVALCQEQVGWRDNSVKIILYFTDDGFHFAGEGVYAGIMKPFREECQLTGDLAANFYQEYSGLEYDYPSPGQLLSILQRENIFPVFVTIVSGTQSGGFYNLSDTHEALRDLFRDYLGEVSTARLDRVEGGDAGIEEFVQNVLATIDEQVLDILSRSRLVPEVIPGITTTIVAKCPEGAVSSEADDSCSSVGLGNTTEFNLTLTLDSCNSFSGKKTMNVRVIPVGQIEIDIEAICSCDCEDEVEVDSPSCSGNGNFSCGVCTCKADYCGADCSEINNGSMCPVGINGKDCSERGKCFVCQCVCSSDLVADYGNTDERLTRENVSRAAFGDACECDYYQCLSDDPDDVVVCSGRGECCDGVCKCGEDENGYQYRSDPDEDGRDCDCPPEEIVCRREGSSSICEGRGECLCNECECPDPYEGEFCEIIVSIEDCSFVGNEAEVGDCILSEKDDPSPTDCQTCLFPSTSNSVSCVLIISEGDQPTSTDMDAMEREVEEYTQDILKDGDYKFGISCFFRDEENCTHEYYILYNEQTANLVFVAEEQRTCSPSSQRGLRLPFPLWVLAIILLAILIIVGILILIIIKVIFMILDYIEVKRLEREVGQADFSKNQNPLYQSPDVEYKNVAYGKE